MRYLKKSPRYVGYVQRAMKQSIFQLMEREAWDTASQGLKSFLVQISLICHLSAELVESIAGHNGGLLAELRQQNAYIRYDAYTDAYLIHRLFLEFLRTKEGMLTAGEIMGTYEKAADWCVRNEYRTDAIGYYAETGNYGAIVSILEAYPGQIPQDIAAYALASFQRAPEDTLLKVDTFAYSYLRLLLSLGRLDDMMCAAGRYEPLLLGLADQDFANRALGCQYAILGQARMLMGIADHQYDFDDYYAKMNQCLTKSPVDPERIKRLHIGPWVNMIGSAKKGSLQDFRRALARSADYVSQSLDNRMAGLEELGMGELNFYQSKLQQATIHILRALDQVRDNGQAEVLYRAYFYLLRIAVPRGNLPKAEQLLRDMEEHKNKSGDLSSTGIFQIPTGWYYYYLQQPQKIPDWLKEGFVPYAHPSFTENYGNQMKAYCCYLTKNYPPLLIYISDLKKQRTVVFSRIAMLTLEACAYYQMKDKKMADASLKEAYEAAIPYDILMPFIEMGKDMRTLAASATRDQYAGIPASWLEEVCRRSATYAKRQSLAISEYRRVTNTDGERALSSLEHRVLVDLVNGLSRSDISTEQRLSINTINSVVSSIYDKLNANSIVEVVRVAIDRNLL
jgi:LuxR family maltose regulon positive regulatory protein